MDNLVFDMLSFGMEESIYCEHLNLYGKEIYGNLSKTGFNEILF